MWSQRASHVRGNHLLPPPSSLCNTRHPWGSELWHVISASNGGNGTKRETVLVVHHAPDVEASLPQTFFYDSENLMHRVGCWGKERSLSFFSSSAMVWFLTVRLLPLCIGGWHSLRDQLLLVAWVSNHESKWTHESCLKDENAGKEPGRSF